MFQHRQATQKRNKRKKKGSAVMAQGLVNNLCACSPWLSSIPRSMFLELHRRYYRYLGSSVDLACPLLPDRRNEIFVGVLLGDGFFDEDVLGKDRMLPRGLTHD